MDVVKNFAKVSVSTGYAAGATSITLSTGHGAKLPDPAADGAFNLVWWNVTDYPDPTDDSSAEIVRCTARAGDVLTVTRAQESTADVDHNAATKTYQMILSLTKKMIDDISSEMIRNIVEDTTPQLGGNLDMQTHKLVGEGGSAGVYVDSGGNVGIGTDSPDEMLTVGDGTGNPKLKLWGNDSTYGGTDWATFSVASVGRLDIVSSDDIVFKVNGGTVPFEIAWGGIKMNDDNILNFGTGADIRFQYDGTNDNLDIYNRDTGARLMVIEKTGNLGIATTTPTAKLDVDSDILRLRTAKTPASAGAAGNQGDWCWDANYLYVCVATNTWKRSAIATW